MNLKLVGAAVEPLHLGPAALVREDVHFKLEGGYELLLIIIGYIPAFQIVGPSVQGLSCSRLILFPSLEPPCFYTA